MAEETKPADGVAALQAADAEPELRPVYGEPGSGFEWYDEEGKGRDPHVGWDLSWGCRVSFAYDEGQLRATVSLSDADLRAGITVRSATRDQLRNFADRILDFLRDTEVCTCNGGWSVDENYWPEDYEMRDPLRPGKGLIPCGNCNHGGWDAPWPPEDPAHPPTSEASQEDGRG